MGQTLDCFCKGMAFTQSHRPEEAIPNSYDKCKPGSMALFKINSLLGYALSYLKTQYKS